MSQVLEESPLKDHVARDLGLSGPVQFILRVGYVTAYPDPVSLRLRRERGSSLAARL
jgi:hypothetical protein